MTELKNPENILLEIPKEQLLEKAIEYKRKNQRLCQICAAYIDEKFELSYSFVDDETNLMTNFRVVVTPDEEVPSISEILPGAVFYENEMKELFGVKVQMISTDYNDKLYRIAASHPFGPEDHMNAPDGIMPNAQAEAAKKEEK